MKKLITSLLLFYSFISFGQENPVALKIGDMSPDIVTKDHSGKIVDLKEILKNGKAVIMFYRGEWCPYCNKYMSQLEAALPQFAAKKVTVIAITPESDASISKVIEKTKATFSIIYDKNRKIMKDWKVIYTVDENMKVKFKGYGLDLEKKQGDWELPVPATYVVGKNGKIEFVHFDQNYQNRADISDILKKL